MNQRLINYIRANENDYLELFKKIIEYESPTHNKEAVDRLVDFIESYLIEYGVQVTRVSNERYGDHLVGEWGEGDEPILFVGHIDTVWEMGTINSRPFTVKDDVITGPGVYDMKGGIFQALYAIKVMKELKIQPKNKVVFLINTDEEVGSPTSYTLIQEWAKKSKNVIVGEPGNLPGGSVKTGRKGFGIFDLVIEGISAHAGADPEKGASAIHEFAKQVQYLESLADIRKGTTINVGVVHGGTRANVVAAKVEAKIDLRVAIEEEANRIIPQILDLKPVNPKTKITITGGLNRPPFERNNKVIELYDKVKTLAAELGFDLPETESGGVSDGNITASVGAPTLCGLGVVGSGAHAVHENCLVSYIPNRIALLVQIFAKI